MLLFLQSARHRPCQLLQLHRFRLPPLKDRLLNIRRQQRQPEHAVDEAPSDASAWAISATDRYLPSSSIRFHRCARASVRINVSSGRGFAGPHASLPSGAVGVRC
jgi:hypothetical protein